MIGRGRRWQRSDDQSAARRKALESVAHQVPKPASDQVAGGGAADTPADRESDQRAGGLRVRLIAAVRPQQGQRDGATARPATPADGRGEVLAAPEPSGRRQHDRPPQ